MVRVALLFARCLLLISLFSCVFIVVHPRVAVSLSGLFYWNVIRHYSLGDVSQARPHGVNIT